VPARLLSAAQGAAAADLVEAARILASRDGVRAVTLTAIATQAAAHASAVRRYYASREEILLTVAATGRTPSPRGWAIPAPPPPRNWLTPWPSPSPSARCSATC
jgi:hypothetical protein